LESKVSKTYHDEKSYLVRFFLNEGRRKLSWAWIVLLVFTLALQIRQRLLKQVRRIAISQDGSSDGSRITPR
jgi:hypothetical protein